MNQSHLNRQVSHGSEWSWLCCYSFLPFLGPGALCCWSPAVVTLLREAALWNRQIALRFSISCFPRGSKMLRKLATKHYNKIWSRFPLHFHPRSPGDPREGSWKPRLRVSMFISTGCCVCLAVLLAQKNNSCPDSEAHSSEWWGETRPCDACVSPPTASLKNIPHPLPHPWTHNTVCFYMLLLIPKIHDRYKTY